MRLVFADDGRRIEPVYLLARKVRGWLQRQLLNPGILFDAAWYAKTYLENERVDPFRHYMQRGWRLGFRPNPFFDADWYKKQYDCSGNPLSDYLLRGNRNPHPLFDASWYVRNYPDVQASRLDPLIHFLHFGRYERRKPHPLFESEWYAERYAADGAAADPFRHYLEKGFRARLDPHPLFDASLYVENNPALLSTGQCALTHFVEEGALRGRSPHLLFDAAWYLRRYPDIAQARVNPLSHYLQFGAFEGRDPHPHFQTSWYVGAYQDVADEKANALVHFVRFGVAEGRKPNFAFEPAWYERKYAHLIPGGMTPFAHFVKTGRFLGLQPGPFFDPVAYRKRYGVSPAHGGDATAELLEHARSHPEADRRDMGRRLLAPLHLTSGDAGGNSTGGRAAPGLLNRFSPGGNWLARFRPKRRIAVQLHAFYPELAPKVAAALGHIPFPFDLYVSIPDANRRESTRRVFRSLSNLVHLEIMVTENRGRDIAPFIVGCGEALAEYDFILHLHTKRSPHNGRLSGWLDYLLENLLGTSENVAAIIQAFDERAELGILFPSTYAPVHPFMRLGGSGPAVRDLLSRMGAGDNELDPLVHASFPSGSMFWMRGAVMRSINRLGLKWDDFPDEAGQDDGTIAHAIERLFPVFALREGLDTLPCIRGDGAFDDCGAWAAPTVLASDVLIIDHGIGGGANKFVEDEIEGFLAQGLEVVRLYRDPALLRPMFERIGKGTRRFLVAPAGETMGQAVGRCRAREVIVNSLYGFEAEIGGVVAAMTEAKKDDRLRLRLMVHDFHLACPSQHLLDDKQNYCGLPSIESDKCRGCVRINENIAPAWREYYALSTWRLQSQALVDLCDEIRFFDETGAEILSQALDVRPEVRTFVPHVLPKTLRPVDAGDEKRPVIGILGTLTHAKGIAVVNELAAYMRAQKLDGEIVVIGGVRATIDPSVRVHGPYIVEDLPAIVESLGVNIVFISSVVPETFCYTLSEAMQMRLPVVAFDLGAQGHRVRQYDQGSVIAPNSSADEIYGALAECWRRFATVREELR